MNKVFPALENLEKQGGLFVLLSRLEYMNGKSRPKYLCGHGGDLVNIYRPPRVLLAPLAKRNLLANIGIFEDVVVFDHYGLHPRIYGHRERLNCPKCFFEKLILEVGPLCPVCRKIIRKGSRVNLFELKESDKRRWSGLAKVMYITEAKQEWAAACCLIKGRKQYVSKPLIWDGNTCVTA
jgi:hypothetical protein